MSKSILVIDTPKTCENCVCVYPSYKDDSLYDCSLTGNRVQIDGMVFGDKPDWCPLHEIPSKKSVRDFNISHSDFEQKGYQQGWNACIDEICGNSM